MKNDKLFIIIAVCLVVVVLLLCGCGEQSDDGSTEVSINTEVSETVSSTDASTVNVSEEVSEDISESEESIPVEHTHEYADAWSSNETDHWKECNCGDKTDTESHAFGEWTTTKEATETEAGTKKRTCSVCDYEEAGIVPVPSHTHTFCDWKSNGTSHWKECECDEKSAQSSHTYGNWVVTKEATCATTGTKKHICTACNYSETVTIPKTNHNYISVVTPPTNTQKGYTTHTCSKCGNVYVDSYTDPVSSYAEGLEYAVNEDGVTCTITGIGTCKDTVLYIPPEIDGYRVTTIGDEAFNYCFHFPQHVIIIIPDSVTEIGNSAFSGCSGISSMTIPDSVTKIGTWAFSGCNFASITIPDSVTEIGANAFTFCISLTSVIIPDSVTEISDDVFVDCTALTNVTIPGSVTAIGMCAFKGCGNLTNVIIPDSVTTIGGGAFEHCNSLTSITIPDSVTEIGSGAFGCCRRLTSVIIPSSVTKIGIDAFGDCTNLTKIYYQGGIKDWLSISFGSEGSNPCCNGADLYFDNKLVTKITIPDSLTSINSFAFYGCRSLTSVTIPDSVSSIGAYVFYGCTKLECNSYDNGYYIGKGNNPYFVLIKAKNTSITSCTIHPDTKLIHDKAFYGCSSLTSVTIPGSVTAIGMRAFKGCGNLTNVIIPDSVTTIGRGAFEDCESLTNITIPDGVTTIEWNVFRNCTNLISVTIPDSVTLIYRYAFYGCDRLTSVIFEDPKGWYASDDYDTLMMVDFPDSATAASYLNLYSFYYWHKEY